MTNETTPTPDIPGLDMIGRGVYVRPQQPYELKGLLFSQADKSKVYCSRDGDSVMSYVYPDGYEVNDSPPMPTSQALNQVMIEESWERFEKQTSVDVGLTVGNMPFSLDINASQTSQVRVEEEAYYAMRNSFIPFWTVYLPDAGKLAGNIKADDIDKIPTPFRHQHRSAYERFFERYGTHYIKRVWVGGKATLVFTVAKSSAMSKDAIKAGIAASQAGSSAHVSQDTCEAKENLQKSSECTVFGKGGDELKLATLCSLDEQHYNEWVRSIKGNPQVIEFDACGIWTLVDDPAKAQALQQAYTESVVFTPLNAVFALDHRLHFFRGFQYFSYNLEPRKAIKSDAVNQKPPKPPAAESNEQGAAKISPIELIREAWPMLYKVGFEHVDAAFIGRYLISSAHEDLGRKLYFFNRDKYLRLDADKKQIDPGYPKFIAEGWPGVTFDRVDAVLNVAPDALYFFRGNQYIRFNTITNRADEGYPQQVSTRWVGVTFDRIDAAVYWGNAKVYFFRGNQYIRYDTVNYRADPGYPKCIIGNYVEDWQFFD